MEKRALRAIGLVAALLPIPLSTAAMAAGWLYLEKNPGAYTCAMGDAVLHALSRVRHGTDCIRHLQRLGVGGRQSHGYDHRNPPPFCAVDRLDEAFAARRSCLAWGVRDRPDLPECDNRRGCVRLHFAPSIVASDLFRAQLIGALTDPCGSLPEPAGLLEAFGPHAMHPGGLCYRAQGAWAIFECDVRRPITFRIRAIDPDSGMVELRKRWRFLWGVI